MIQIYRFSDMDVLNCKELGERITTMAQKKRVLDYINEFGSISSLEAFRDLGVTRLSAVIFNLKEDGYEFDTKTERCVNRYGEKVGYARYSLKNHEG